MSSHTVQTISSKLNIFKLSYSQVLLEYYFIGISYKFWFEWKKPIKPQESFDKSPLPVGEYT